MLMSQYCNGRADCADGSEEEGCVTALASQDVITNTSPVLTFLAIILALTISGELTSLVKPILTQANMACVKRKGRSQDV